MFYRSLQRQRGTGKRDDALAFKVRQYKYVTLRYDGEATKTHGCNCNFDTHCFERKVEEFVNKKKRERERETRKKIEIHGRLQRR